MQRIALPVLGALVASAIFLSPGVFAQAGEMTLRAAAEHEADCRRGDGEACWVVGRWYRGGLRLPQDLPKARQLLSLGCGRQHQKSCDELNELDLEEGTPAQVGAAVGYFDRRCSSGEVQRCMDMARRYLEGKPRLSKDEAQARRFADRACDQGDAAGCRLVGQLAYQGLGGPVDGARVVSAFDRACQGGDNDSCVALAIASARGEVVPANGPLALSAAERACSRRDADGCMLAAHIAHEGPAGQARDGERARRHADQACGLGFADGCLLLEQVARNGEFGPPDMAAAMDAADRGCQLRDKRACQQLVAHAAERVNAGTADMEKFGAALLKACHNGRIADMCTDLGLMLAAGNGVKKDELAGELYLMEALKIDPNHERAKEALDALRSARTPRK